MWYFTDRGLTSYMAEKGFLLVQRNTMEQVVGREDIGTYAFKRVCLP
jgi:hypothetical protein